VAGKTGTTENYGDAWFVGYTPQLTVAVWVGYPHSQRPMLTEFHGRAVAGGTFPALIFKSFSEQALPYLQAQPEAFPYPQIPYAVPKQLVLRDGEWQLDNGNCRELIQVLYFSGHGPARTADCRPNEVEVPSVLGETLEAAKARLALQPLRARPIYKPAEPGQPVGIVVREIPRVGDRLSSFDEVMLVLAKPLHGIVPRVVDLPLSKARRRLARLGATVIVRTAALDGARRGTVISQVPRPGVAAWPKMRVTLAVARG
jgi:hypothetical protein